MDSRIEELFGDPIQLTEAVRKAVDEADSFKQDCADVNGKVETLAKWLRSAARMFSYGGASLYDRPTRRIMVEVSKTLERCLTLAKKCKKSGMLKRVITITSATDFRKVNGLLDNAIGDVTWLLNVSARGEDRIGIEGLPPIASTDPMLAWVWGQIALVQGGSRGEQEEGASYLASLAADNDRNGKLIIEEEGVPPLLILLKEGNAGCQFAAANVLGTLATDQERIQQILSRGALPVFVHILQDGPMKVQAKVAWALSKMVSQDPDAQNAFGGGNVIRPLVALLLFETMDDSSINKTLKATSWHSLVKAVNKVGLQKTNDTLLESTAGLGVIKSNKSDNGMVDHDWPVVNPGNYDPYNPRNGHRRGQPGSMDKLPEPIVAKREREIRHVRGFSDSYFHGLSSRELTRKEREKEDPQIKRELKAQVTCALWKLAENNTKNSRRITDTKALLCFAKLIEKESGEVQRNSVMAVMEIAGAAERDVELRRFAFKTNSASAKAVVDQLLRVIEQGEPELQIPCLKAIGCLARTFPARETKVIAPLVDQLTHREPMVAAEAATALQKFAHTQNFLHMEHSKTIVDAAAVPHLMRLLTVQDKDVQVPAVILLSYLAMHMGNHETFWESAALRSLKSVARTNVSQIQSVAQVLPGAIQHLELYQAASHHHQHGHY